MLEQRHKMALAQLQKEMNAEMQKQREQINRELEEELKEELEVMYDFKIELSNYQ